MNMDSQPDLRLDYAAMRFSTFKQLTHEQVVALASRLFVALGADPAHHEIKSTEWRDNSLKGNSAVYEVSHGYRLGKPGEDMAVTVIEQWSEHENANAPVAHAIDIHTSGSIELTVRYRHGQLRCTFDAPGEKEKNCLDILENL